MKMKTKARWVLFIRYCVIAFWVLFTLLPIYTAFVASLTEYKNLGKSFLYPVDWAWHNWIDIWTRINLLSYLKSTMIYALASALITVILAIFAGYALSRFRFKGKKLYSSTLLVTQVLPQVVIVVPVFMLVKALGLYDKYLGVIITIVATSMAFPTMLMRSYFDSVPRELEEAAAIDGSSRVQTLFKVVLPITLPGIGTSFALAFFSGWGQYLYPMILTRSDELTPVTVGISRMIDNQTPWEMVMTGTLISIIPAVIIYMFVQKSLIKGMASGAVK